MVLEQIANLSVVNSACGFESCTLRCVNTCAETMSAMEEQKLAVGIINLLSANIISDGSRTV